MRKNGLAVAILLVMTMLLGIMTTAFAADYTPVDPDDQGKTGIVGGDTLTFTEDTVWANLTARWGVRVIFQDGDEWNNAELKSELIPVTDSAAGSTTAPEDPSHDGWTFTGWERVDTNNGSSTLNDDGTVTGINGPGPIIYQAVYEPVPPKTGGLTVSKTISGDAADAAQAFTFTVTLSDTTVSGEFGDMAFEEGIATFTLKGGESVTAEGLPAGVSYIVAESDNDGYEVTKTGDTGEIADGETATAAFTNTKNSTPPEDPEDPPAEPETGSLTISKTVTGTAGEKDKQFTFTVTIGAEGTYNYTGSKTGTITSGGTVQLKHGESITISGIPVGTSYAVVESDNSGYEVTKTGDTGTIAADTTAKADFTNKKDAAPVTPPDKPGDPGTPKTGDDSNIALWISLLLASFIGMTACIVLFRKKRAGKHMKTFMMLLLVGVMAFSCFGVTNAFAAEDGTTGYTYGQYDMTYLPGTTDTVTNMPANETGLTPGSDSPYTVSSTVPVREGFEFIDWTLTWGTMEQPETPVDYSDALTVSKKATAAAAGDANTARAYTITLEAKVNINADNPVGLFVENLTVTDTIENEFALNSVTAEILDSAGSVVSSNPVSAAGPTVTHDFGNVEHGYTARLILEVTAQPDYIGSNGVYTNVGESGWTYKHTDPEATEAEAFSVTCPDKPQVNVPIRSFVVTQDHATQRMGLLVTVFNGVDWFYHDYYSGEYNDYLEYSESDEDLFRKYDQINGTVTNDKWIDPDEGPHNIGDAVHISGGVPENTNYCVGRNNWRVPTNHPLGDFPVYLYATFTPDEVTDGEFADATTAEPVGARTEVGVGLVTIIPRQAVIEIETDYTVHYYENGTTNSVAPDKFVKDGGFSSDPVTERAIDVPGWTALDPTEKSIILEVDASLNVITFYYEKDTSAPVLTDYVVKYLDKTTREPVAVDKVVEGKEVGTTVTEVAVAADGYRVSDTDDEGKPQPEEISLELVDGENVITFWYDKLTSYTVKYLDKDTNEPVAPDRVVGLDGEGNPDLPVRTEVTETAVDVEGYTALDPTEATLVLDESGNEIVFWYEQAPVLTDYVVKYLDKDTNEPVADEKTESGLEVGTSVTETAIPVSGYAALDPTEAPLGLAETGNEIIFYYQKLTTYTIHYCDDLTGEEIAPPKTVPDVPVGLTVTEYAISIAGYIPLDDWTTFPLLESGNDYYLYYIKSNAD